LDIFILSEKMFSSGDLLEDGVHLSGKGHKMYSTWFIDFLEDVVNPDLKSAAQTSDLRSTILANPDWNQ